VTRANHITVSFSYHINKIDFAVVLIPSYSFLFFQMKGSQNGDMKITCHVLAIVSHDNHILGSCNTINNTCKLD